MSHKYFCFIQNNNSIENFKIKLDNFGKNSKKKNLRGHCLELSDELLNRIWFVYRCCIKSIYVLCKDSFLLLKVDVRRQQKVEKPKEEKQTNNDNFSMVDVRR